MWIKELGSAKTAIISNLDNQAITVTDCFTSSETASAVMRTTVNSLSFLPYLIEFTTISEEISNKDREEILAFLKEQGITKVICVGRTAVDCLFPSISKGKMMSQLVVSQAIPTLEIPEISAAVVKSYFTVKSGEDAIEYRQRIDYLHEFKSQVKIKTTKIDGEEQFLKLLEVLTAQEGKLGLDFETNAVEPMSEGFKLTEIGLSFSADINHAYGYHYDVPFEGLSERALKAFEAFLDANYQRIYTYNCTFEIAVAFRLVKKFYKFQDVIVMASVNAERSSLKDLLRKKFGAAIWEADVKEFQAEYKKFVSKVGRNAALREACYAGDIETLRASGNAGILAFLEYAEANFEPSEIVEALRHFPSAWGATPKTILGVYCALDAAYTVVLAHHYQLEYPEVMPSYHFCLRQPWMAVKFELHGFMWDENAANALEQEMYAEAVPLMRNIIEACKANLSPELAMDWATYGQQKIPFNFVYYTGKTQKEKVMLVDTPEKEIEWLKMFWNPGSNTAASRDFFWKTYLTEELRLGVILNLFLETSDLMGRLPEVMSVFPSDDFLKSNSIKDILSFLSAYVKGNKNKTANFIGSMLKTAIEELPNYIGRYASDTIKYQYQIHSRYLGVDSDKPETWTKEFKLLFDLFLLKKILKVISANINGVQGRGSVHLVDTTDTTYGDNIWLRKKPYESLTAEEKRTGSLLTNVEFNSLAANSGRWSAAFHSISAGSPMRAIMIPRRPNHVLVHADYSALEVTVLARVTGDRNLIQVFLDGKDIHRYAASKIFEKPEEDITHEERRFSKACFPAGTKVKLLSGELVDISELSSRVGEWTYGCLPTGEVVPAQIKAWAESKKTKDLVKVNLHDGNSFVCTPDHEIMLKDGSYVEAKDLKPEDSVMSFYSSYNYSDYHEGYELILDGFAENETHRRVRKYVELKRPTDDYYSEHAGHTHHVDFNKENNSPDNLVVCSKEWHIKEHSRTSWKRPLNCNRWEGLSKQEILDKLNAEGTFLSNKDRTTVKAMMLEECKDWYNSRSYRGTLSTILGHIKSLKLAGIEVTDENFNTYKTHTGLIRAENLKDVMKLSLETLTVMADQFDNLNTRHPVKWEDSEERGRAADRLRGVVKACFDDPEFRAKHSVWTSNNMKKLNTSDEAKRLQQRGKVLKAVNDLYVSGYDLDSIKSVEELVQAVLEHTRYGTHSISLKRVEKYFFNNGESLEDLLELAKSYNHRVVSVEVLSLEEEVPVYDIETSTHNFVVAFDKTDGVFVSNCVFSLLYGKGVESFAFDNTGGDVQKAQAIFDAFFKQFPGIKEFIHKAHAEIDRTNAYVTTMLGNKVPIDVNAGGGAKYRQAQNQIIQSLGSLVAGTSMYQFLEYCEKQGYDCAPYAFTHDAYDDSTSVDTIFEYLEGMEEVMVNRVRQSVGIPVSIDYELAANGRDLCSIDFTSREQYERTVTIKGTSIAIEGLLSRLKLSKTYDLEDVEIETSEPEDYGWSELWGVGKALKYEWGKTIQQSKATFKVKYRKN